MWASKEDLVKRHGQKKIDEISTREIYDEDTNSYIGDCTQQSRDEVIDIFLEDAKRHILWQLSRCYSLTSKEIEDLIDSGQEFRIILTYHVKLTVAMLKGGGDCDECDKCKTDFADLCNQTDICSDEGVCLKKESRYAVTDIKSCLPDDLCCGCHKEKCCCEY